MGAILFLSGQQGRNQAVNTSAELRSASAPAYTIAVDGETAFQDVDRRGLYDDLCDPLIVADHLDADALNTL